LHNKSATVELNYQEIEKKIKPFSSLDIKQLNIIATNKKKKIIKME